MLCTSISLDAVHFGRESRRDGLQLGFASDVGRDREVALVELSVVEQRYHAVMEVLAGMSVTEVAERYAVHRNSLHEWVRRHGRGCIAVSSIGPIARSTTPGRPT
jgi:Homeodomain-like domain